MGLTGLRSVFRLLDKCAPGHERFLGPHSWTIYYQGRTFINLPKSGHDSKGEVPLPKVAKLVQILKLDRDCAAGMIPGLARHISKRESSNTKKKPD